MAKICKVTGKRHLIGHKISHSNIKTKRRFNINLQTHRFWLSAEKRFVRLRVSTQGIRIIDKLGIETVLNDLKKWGNDVQI
jgi:large subunit ribosomal protein L28